METKKPSARYYITKLGAKRITSERTQVEQRENIEASQKPQRDWPQKAILPSWFAQHFEPH